MAYEWKRRLKKEVTTADGHYAKIEVHDSWGKLAARQVYFVTIFSRADPQRSTIVGGWRTHRYEKALEYAEQWTADAILSSSPYLLEKLRHHFL